jgi:hypothetical protein
VLPRFETARLLALASVDVLGADGTVETITGTTIHPVWSVDRQEWVPLAELTEGEDQNSTELPDGSGFSSGLRPPASSLRPPACFVYKIDLFRNVLMERYGLCFAHRMVLDIGTFIEFRLPLLQKPNLVRRASRNV